ncbi:MAG: ABC transporter substrate-binding protein [Butyrivibrio sp.]|nr:ABC transporter substrate-binding protein [Butyrivibrio sp.]
MEIKRIGATILTATMVAGMLAGCSSSTEEATETVTETATEAVSETAAAETEASAETAEAETETAAAEKNIEATEITFWHAMSGALEEELTELTDLFNNTNEYGITVTLVNQGKYSDLETKLMASAAAGTLPDMAQAYNNYLTEYIDMVVPLDDFVANDFDNYEDILEGYREECSEFGFIHGLPFNKSAYVLFYNKTLFDELGLEVPTTWAEVESVGETILAEKNIPAIGVDDRAGFVEATIRQNGGTYLTETGAGFDTEEGKEAIEYIMNLYNNGYASLPADGEYFSTILSNGGIASYIGSSAGASYITAEGWELGVAAVPGNKENAAYAAGTNLVMFTQDENKQLATWEYMKFLTSTESTTEWAIATGYLPVRNSAYESDEYQKFIEADITAAAAYAEKDYLFVTPTFDATTAVRSQVNSTLEELILNKADGETAFNTLLETVNAQY